MTVAAGPDTRTRLTAMEPVVEFDPLLNKAYQKTRLGPDIVAWLAWLDIGGIAYRTLDSYERTLSHAALMYPRLALTDWTDAELGHVARTFPAKSRRVRVAAIRSFFRWAVRTGRIDRNPCDRLPTIKRAPQKWIDVFTDGEINDLCSLPSDDAILMHLLFEAGLRKGEAQRLQVRRLRLEPPPPHVAIVAGKGGKDRVIAMSHRLHVATEEFLLLNALDSQAFLWYTRPGGGKEISRARAIGDGSFDRWWKRCLTEAGVRYRNPHVARHTFATRWLRRGGRITTLSQVMGHTSIKTTFDLYGHLDTRDVVADLALIDAGDNRPDS